VILCCLCVLYNQIYRNFDKKFFKSVWDLYKKAPVVNLCGTVVWFSADFFIKRMPNLARVVEKSPEQASLAVRQTYYKSKVQLLPQAFQQSFAIVNLWLIKMQAINDLSVQACLTYDQLLLQGVDYANYITNMVTSILNLSISLDLPMTKSCILELCRYVELLKAIQISYYEKQEFLTLGKQYIVQSTNRRLLAYIQAARKRIVSDKKYSEKRLDILSGLVLAANALNGPPTRERILIANYGLAMANRQKTFKPEENVDECLRRLETFSLIETR
jgi:WASH complex subunit 7